MNHAITVKAPSNIALIKYWGKSDVGRQWPSNDSWSMTLSTCQTICTARIADDWSISLPADVLQHDPTNARQRVATFLTRVGQMAAQSAGISYAPLALSTSNTFPANSGIASSASAFSAITLAALGAWTATRSDESAGQSLEDGLADAGLSLQKIAALARLGSGSACRSLCGGFVHWQRGESPDDQSVRLVKPASHWPLCDTIVVVARDAKTIPSSIAHQYAPTSPFFATRVAGLNERAQRLESAIQRQNIFELGTLIEADALEMHAITMTTSSPTPYLTPVSHEIMVWTREYRQKTGDPVFFTVDAGPNVHLIHEPATAAALHKALSEDFPGLAIIPDRVGDGPVMARGLDPDASMIESTPRPRAREHAMTGVARR